MVIGYARVSTAEQNLDVQRDALQAAGCEKIFTDEGVSGAAIKRAGLTQALGALGEGDTLVIWKLDRLGRSLSFLIDLTEKLARDGIAFKSLADQIDTTTPAGKFFFHVMGAMAEFERALIRERSKAGIDAARKRGKHLGRPPALTRAQIAHARAEIEAGRNTVSGMAELFQVDRSTLYRALARAA